MKNTFTKKIENNNKKLVKKVTKTMKKNPNTTVAIAATAGTGFLSLGVLNVVQHMRNRKALKKAKAMDEAQASSANANDTQQAPEQEPQTEPTAPTTNETPTSSNTDTATAPVVQQAPTINIGMLNAAFNEFMCARQDPRSNGMSDDHIAHVIATRFSSDPSVVAYIRGFITDNFDRINLQNLQAAAMRQNNTPQKSEPNAFEVFDEINESEETQHNETNGTNPDEGKYPASSKKQQKNGGRGNNKKK